MFTIQFINESNHLKYYDNNQLQNLIKYVCDTNKTFTDSVRTNPNFQGPFIGCNLCPFAKRQLLDGEVALQQMLFNHKVHTRKVKDFAKHRVISFDPQSLVFPQDLSSLGERIIQFYWQWNYMALYAVHANHINPHIHVVVDAVSFQTGNAFHISFEPEYLKNITLLWWENFEKEILLNNQKKEIRENLLYGEIQYGHISLSCTEQIQANKLTRNKTTSKYKY